VSIVVENAQGDRCGCCSDPITTEFAFFDEDLRAIICPECRMRLMFANGQLNFKNIKGCVQISGNKPIEP
jgi:hypothetical protein